MTHTVRLKAYFATFDTVHSFSCFLCNFLVYDAHLCQRSKGHGQTTLPCNNSESILSYQAEDSVWILLISKIVQLMNTMQVSYQELRIRYMSDRNRIRKFRTDQIRILLKCYSCFNTLCSGSTRTDLAGKISAPAKHVLGSDRIRIRNSEVITNFIWCAPQRSTRVSRF